MIVFTTETGSIYEVDTDARKVRCIYSDSGPTERIDSGRSFVSVGNLAVGEKAVFIWGEDTPAIDPDETPVMKMTITSRITSLNAAV